MKGLHKFAEKVVWTFSTYSVYICMYVFNIHIMVKMNRNWSFKKHYTGMDHSK